MAEIKVKTGKKIRHEETEEKQRSFRSQQISTEREALKQISEEKAPTNSKTVLIDMPLDMISDRTVNKFRMSGIEQLAEAIEKDGLYHNIIVVPNENGDGFMVSSGHRRLHAYRLLRDRYEKEHPGTENPYYKIKTEIKSGLTKEQEEGIYLRTNSFSRNTTLMEAIANTNPEDMNFDDPAFKEEYLTYMYGDNALERYVKGEIKDKLNGNSLADYVYRKIKDTFQDLECTPEAVRKYLRVYNKCSETIRDKFFDNELSIKQLMDITSNFSIDEQNLIYNSEDPDAKKKEILQRHRKATKKKDIKKTDQVKTITNEISKFTKPLMMLSDEIDKIEYDSGKENQKILLDKVKETIYQLNNLIKDLRK